MRKAAKAADISVWEHDLLQDEIRVTEKGREPSGVGPSERVNFARFLQAVHPDDQERTRGPGPFMRWSAKS